MTRVFIPDQPDIVLIFWSRNPLVSGSPRRIVESRVIGTAFPCRSSLATGNLLATALACLLDNDVGFKVVCRKSTSSISGIIVLQRSH
ncbi:hypothetical protein [Paenibacillus silvisoli]|uniref:hypothetical protein n=1 Tax=Paenibacillus silvisoli TaxID=3110539 RepID=UPI0028038D18|nr:hypothetical protein [Paenibacillus silvisoli]